MAITAALVIEAEAGLALVCVLMPALELPSTTGIEIVVDNDIALFESCRELSCLPLQLGVLITSATAAVLPLEAIGVDVMLCVDRCELVFSVVLIIERFC